MSPLVSRASASAWPGFSAEPSSSAASPGRGASSASFCQWNILGTEKDLVLVVEDNKASSDLMAYLLRAAGHRVMTCTDGADAITIAGRERPRVIVMDLQLERMSGLLRPGGVLAVIGRARGSSLVDVALTVPAVIGTRLHLVASSWRRRVSAASPSRSP